MLESMTATELQATDVGQTHRHIKNVVGLSMFVNTQPSPLDRYEAQTNQHKNKRLKAGLKTYETIQCEN